MLGDRVTSVVFGKKLDTLLVVGAFVLVSLVVVETEDFDIEIMESKNPVEQGESKKYPAECTDIVSKNPVEDHLTCLVD